MSAGSASDNSATKSSRDVNPVHLFAKAKQEQRPLYVCAPMVRYSKLPFRLLIQDYNVDMSWTPMILAHEFIRHPVARDLDFTTHATEAPLIAQFASSDPFEFARAATLIGPWVNGVDLNCGCPQSWAIREGIGCGLMGRPELVRDMARAARAAYSRRCPEKSVSVKIRIHVDIQETIRFLRIVSTAGIDWVTVHARTRSQRSSTAPDLDALAVLKAEFPDLPFIANGDVYSCQDARDVVAKTGVEGVMSARGLLENPCLFAGHVATPDAAVGRFLEHVASCGLRFELVLYHVNEMLLKRLSRKQRTSLMACRDLIELTDWLEDRIQLDRRYREV